MSITSARTIQKKGILSDCHQARRYKAGATCLTDSCNACKNILNGHKSHVCINASISVCVQTSKFLAGAASSASQPAALRLQTPLHSFLCPETPMDSLEEVCSKLPFNCVLAGPVASHQRATTARQSAATMAKKTLDPSSLAMAITPSVVSRLHRSRALQLTN